MANLNVQFRKRGAQYSAPPYSQGLIDQALDGIENKSLRSFCNVLVNKWKAGNQLSVQTKKRNRAKELQADASISVIILPTQHHPDLSSDSDASLWIGNTITVVIDVPDRISTGKETTKMTSPARESAPLPTTSTAVYQDRDDRLAHLTRHSLDFLSQQQNQQQQNPPTVTSLNENPTHEPPYVVILVPMISEMVDLQATVFFHTGKDWNPIPSRGLAGFEFSLQGVNYRVYNLDGMGNSMAAWAVSVLIDTIRGSSYVCLLGIAGGIGEAQVGDVILADVVYDWSEGMKLSDPPSNSSTQTPQVDQKGEYFSILLQRAGQPYRMSHKALHALSSSQLDDPDSFRKWRNLATRAMPGSPMDIDWDFWSRKLQRTSEELKAEVTRAVAAQPALRVGPVAASPFVISSNLFQGFLLRSHRKTLGVEMEAGGFLLALHREGLADKAILLRGISDCSSDVKELLDSQSGAFRQAAMANASHFLLTMLSSPAILKKLE